jgi:predicted amidophosphoribosyltransferase
MSHTTFNCPYCWSDVPVQASICGHCTRDLVMFKPLALKLQTLADEVAQLKILALS